MPESGSRAEGERRYGAIICDRHPRMGACQCADARFAWVVPASALLAAQERVTEAERERDEWRRISAEQQADYGQLQLRAEAAESQVVELKEALTRIATAHAPAKHLQNIARAALSDEADG